jgi:hypothetical protein
MSLVAVMTQFHNNDVGSSEFWKKVLVLLDDILKNEPDNWQPLNSDEMITLLQILTKHDKNINQTLASFNDSTEIAQGERVWKQLFEEYQSNLGKLKYDHYQLYKTFVCFCHLLTAGNQLAEPVIESWVKMGFDSDELVELGPKRAVKFIEKLAHYKPGLGN